MQRQICQIIITFENPVLIFYSVIKRSLKTLKNTKPSSFLQKTFSIWCYTWFIVPYALLFPIQFIFLQFKNTHKAAHYINVIWSNITLSLCFMHPRLVKKDFKKPELAVYCANHGSFLDIPTIFATVPGFFTIIGKKELFSVPLLGYMFKRLYIAVDRSSGKSRSETLIRSRAALNAGRTLVLFPEGRIDSEVAPQLLPFKDGAFLLAIEKQIPLVPVTIPYNWIILPDGSKNIYHHKMECVFHEPISTTTYTLDDVSELREKVFTTIHNEIQLHLK